jgi:glycosyltransferase involved in cell wall biosynthesis
MIRSTATTSRVYDGVICFGGADWWYHNRGHYDMQMCREFSKHVPVLYVNSLGVRIPKLTEGSMFLKRVSRKLKSWRRGFVRINDRFAVVSPISLPGKLAGIVGRRVLLAQIRRAAKRMGIRNPLIWVECPTAAGLIDQLPRVGLVYQRTDRYESFPGVNKQQIILQNRLLQAEADVTLFCSNLLYSEEATQCRCAKFVDHGVDVERFVDAGSDANRCDPDDVREIPHPRVGYVGSIDPHTFDGQLLVEVARAMPDLNFVLVGPCALPESLWSDSAGPPQKIHRLGQKPYEQVAAYMAACDVLIMPWHRNDWIKACNPVKLKEYLAVGRPIVTTPFDELHRYGGLAHVATDARSFERAIRAALGSTHSAAVVNGRERVRGESWTGKAASVMLELQSQGIVGLHQKSEIEETFSRVEQDLSQASRRPVAGVA